jgi:multimeric flavodoxin WrbA
MNVLIVYYSNEGSTAKVAEGLAQAAKGTVRQLVSQRGAGPGSILAAMLGLGTRLVNADYDVSGRDVVVLMTPVWAGSPAPAINTFIAHAQLRDKRVFFVSVGVLPTNARTVAVLERRLKARGALVIGHQEVLGKAPRMSGPPKGKEPRVPARPDPTDEELIAAGTDIAHTLQAVLAPGENEVQA